MKDLRVIDIGNIIGTFRRLDDVNRIVIPKEYFEYLKYNKNDKLEIFLLQDGLYITKR